jgi:hypothetical protein
MRAFVVSSTPSRQGIGILQTMPPVVKVESKLHSLLTLLYTDPRRGLRAHKPPEAIFENLLSSSLDNISVTRDDSINISFEKWFEFFLKLSNCQLISSSQEENQLTLPWSKLPKRLSHVPSFQAVITLIIPVYGTGMALFLLKTVPLREG